MKKLLSLFAGLFLATTMSFAGNYQVNDEKIDAQIEQSQEMSILEITSSTSTPSIAANFNQNPNIIAADMDKGTLGFIVLTIGYFVGVVPLFGIHRIVMGSGGKIAALYCVTLAGICGVVPTIDWIVLLIRLINKEGAGSYENNDKLFGWK